MNPFFKCEPLYKVTETWLHYVERRVIGFSFTVNPEVSLKRSLQIPSKQQMIISA